jgi:PGF-CTERM protein
MNRKTVVVLLLLAGIIFAGAPESFARPQYLTNLTAVYGGGTCGTCHVIASGMRNFSGMFGQNNSNGTYVPRNTNRTPGQRRSNGTFGMRNSTNRTLPLNSYGMLFENQPDHVTDPSAALMAIGQPPTATATDTPTDTPAGTPSTPGFGIVLSFVGLFAMVLLARRRNK